MCRRCALLAVAKQSWSCIFPYVLSGYVLTERANIKSSIRYWASIGGGGTEMKIGGTAGITVGLGYVYLMLRMYCRF